MSRFSQIAWSAAAVTAGFIVGPTVGIAVGVTAVAGAVFFSPSPPKEQTFKITMLGARGAGKTSVLAAIYDTFDRHAKNFYLSLSPSNATRIQLSDALVMLQSSVKTIEVGGHMFTGERRTYEFKLWLPREEPLITLEFRDYPGDWLEDTAKSDEVLRYIQESDVVLWAIDAAALLEGEGRYEERFNKTLNIRSLLSAAFQKEWPKEDKKLFLVVPIKCETYLRNVPHRAIELLKKVEEKCTSAIKKYDNHIALAITSVQTLGNVCFSKIIEEEIIEKKGTTRNAPKKEEDTSVVFIHRRTNKDRPYEPKNVEQVLNYMLPFILRRYLDKNPNIDKEKYRDYFESAIREMSETRNKKEEEGFKILHGENLINSQ